MISVDRALTSRNSPVCHVKGISQQEPFGAVAMWYVSASDPTVHTNTVEGFFSVFKRGMRGVYQHASKRHLHRYAAEFDFRYSNRIALGIDDQARFATMVEGAWGRRLTYRSTHRQEV